MDGRRGKGAESMATKMTKLQKIFKKLKNTGDTIVLPWAELPSGRPDADAYMGWKDQFYHLDPEEAGLRVTRKTAEDYEEWKVGLKMGLHYNGKMRTQIYIRWPSLQRRR